MPPVGLGSVTTPAPRYSRICSISNSAASQWTSWQLACRRIDDPRMSASAMTATGSSVSSALAHMGQVTGNRTPGSFHAPSFPSLLFNRGTDGDHAGCHSKDSNACAPPMPCGLIAASARAIPPAPCTSFAPTAGTSSIVGHGRQCRIHTVNGRRMPYFLGCARCGDSLTRSCTTDLQLRPATRNAATPSA